MFTTNIWLNVTNRFGEAKVDRDVFVKLPETSGFSLDGDSPESAAELAFEMGNRQSPDAKGKSWPSHVRSVSTGDIVEVGFRLFTVDSVGWTDVTNQFSRIHLVVDEDTARSLAELWGAAAPRWLAAKEVRS